MSAPVAALARPAVASASGGSPAAGGRKLRRVNSEERPQSAPSEQTRVKTEESAPEESQACGRGVKMVFAGFDMCLCDLSIRDSTLLAMGRKIYYALKARRLNVQQHLVDEGLEPATMDIQGVVKK